MTRSLEGWRELLMPGVADMAGKHPDLGMTCAVRGDGLIFIAKNRRSREEVEEFVPSSKLESARTWFGPFLVGLAKKVVED